MRTLGAPKVLLISTVAALGAAFALPPALAGAATITPTPGFFADEFAANGDCSLREAVQVANDNVNNFSCGVTGTLGTDTIELQAGTYELSLTGNEGSGNQFNDLDILTGPAFGGLTIDGAGADQTTIDTDDDPEWTHRVIEADSFAGTTTVLRDISILDGHDSTGSGGGAVRVGIGDLVIERVRIAGSTTSTVGGALRANVANLTVDDSTFEGNSAADSAGGLRIGATTGATVDDTVVRGNTVTAASANAGGVEAFGALTVTDSVVADNSAIDPGAAGAPAGGGLQVVSGTTTLRRTTFSGNSVEGGNAGSGGGIHIQSPGSLVAVNSLLSGNDAVDTGGNGAGARISGAAATATFVNSTIADNPVAAGGASALLHPGAGAINVRGSIVETSGAAAACDGTITSLDDNVFTDSTCGGEVGNDDADADPLLGPLADEGGPEVGAPGLLEPLQTRSPAAGSTAIDHVPSGDCLDHPAGALTTDERGFPRPFDGDEDNTADCDAGAVELLTCLGEPADHAGTPGSDTLIGTGGDDVFVALGGNDEIQGLGGDDTICGGDGTDNLLGSGGNDELDGGANPPLLADGDFADYSDSTSAVTASVADNSATGEGADTFVPGTIENLLGSAQGDVLTGDGGPNLIGGLAGDDTLNGLGGDDGLDGQSDVDEVQFAGAPGPVTAELQVLEILNDQGVATGFGTDILFGFEKISGGAFGDTLTGNSASNELNGLAGADTLSGLGDADTTRGGAGPDVHSTLDGIVDTVDCGGDADSASFDLSPLETFVNCPNSDGDALIDILDACPTQAGTLANGCPAPQADQPTQPPAKKKCKKGKKLKKVKGKLKCVKKKRKK